MALSPLTRALPLTPDKLHESLKNQINYFGKLHSFLSVFLCSLAGLCCMTPRSQTSRLCPGYSTNQRLVATGQGVHTGTMHGGIARLQCKRNKPCNTTKAKVQQGLQTHTSEMYGLEQFYVISVSKVLFPKHPLSHLLCSLRLREVCVPGQSPFIFMIPAPNAGPDIQNMKN